jgi:UTP--glucose-1-phosphate uridylyltransferase
VVDKPLIQYAVEEALLAGARKLVFITGASKRAIEDHFDSDEELEHLLEAQGKSDLLNQIRSVLPSYATCIYIRQSAPLGLGHAVLCAQPAVGSEPFFVHLADDLIRGNPTSCLEQMAEVYAAKRASVLGVEQVPHRDTEKYGIVEIEADKSSTGRVRSIVEKPKPSEAPSNLAVVGRYVLTASIFEHLARLGRGAGGEIQLTDGIAALMGEAVYAYRFTGKRYDCGSKLGYLQATVEYALGHPSLGADFRKYLIGISKSVAAPKKGKLARKGAKGARKRSRPAGGK